MDKKML